MTTGAAIIEITAGGALRADARYPRSRVAGEDPSGRLESRIVRGVAAAAATPLGRRPPKPRPPLPEPEFDRTA